MVKKRQTRLDGFDEKFLALYARGMTVRDIQAQLEEMYGVEVSPTLISNVTDAVIDEVKTWQSRSFDALVVKVRENDQVINKAVHLALGVNLEGHKELLGIWITQNEGAKFWLLVFTELHNRGLKDIFIACIDGLTGLAEAVETVYPKTRVQLCMVHKVRSSLRYVFYKRRKEVCADLRLIYSASSETEAEFHLELFAEKWDARYPTISKTWREHWAHIVPMFNFPLEIRSVIYTTNAIESMNMTLRRVTRNHRIFPHDDAFIKVVFLAVANIAKRWTMPIKDWRPALNRFAIEFEGRLPR